MQIPKEECKRQPLKVEAFLAGLISNRLHSSREADRLMSRDGIFDDARPFQSVNSRPPAGAHACVVDGPGPRSLAQRGDAFIFCCVDRVDWLDSWPTAGGSGGGGAGGSITMDAMVHLKKIKRLSFLSVGMRAKALDGGGSGQMKLVLATTNQSSKFKWGSLVPEDSSAQTFHTTNETPHTLLADVQDLFGVNMRSICTDCGPGKGARQRTNAHRCSKRCLRAVGACCLSGAAQPCKRETPFPPRRCTKVEHVRSRTRKPDLVLRVARVMNQTCTPAAYSLAIHYSQRSLLLCRVD